MAEIQNYFDKFNANIKMDYTTNSFLRNKRAIIIKDLRIGLKKLFVSAPPTFKVFHQGSYVIGTGVRPLVGDDFDIDIGIAFNISKKEFQPTLVKAWVFNALNTLARNVEYKRPCIRVQYYKNKEKNFHVDLAIYTSPGSENSWDKNYYIAKGYFGSKEANIVWEVSEPARLVELFKKKFRNAKDREQFRRVIRYLKRWKDYNFSSDGHAKPRGIAITALAYNFFNPTKSYSWNDNKHYYDDLRATANLVSAITNRFGWAGKISVNLPVQPYNDLFEKMTHIQSRKFKEKLVALSGALTFAANESGVCKACRKLQKVFGDDFPTPY